MLVRKTSIYLTILYITLVTILSLIPISGIAPREVHSYDKVIHLCFYLGANILLLLCATNSSKGKISIWSVIFVTLVTISYSVIIEFVQPLMGRSCDVDDMIANSIGALVGAILFLTFKFSRHAK